MAMTPAVFGVSGLSLTTAEKAFFRDSDPAGYIIFGRNIESKAQLRALTDDLRAIHGRDDLAILIDQEGGRVARMQGRFSTSFTTLRPRPRSRQRVSMPRRLPSAFAKSGSR